MLDAKQYSFLISGIVLLLISLYFFFQKKDKQAISSLILGALIIRLVVISIDPFLHLWDEHFHALVAKNMMQHPFKPMLYAEPILYTDSLDWTKMHIWLHKQPLFMWQMALSMHVFGVNEFAVRLPSALLGAIQCYMVYRIGRLLVNREVGYFAAFLWVTPYYHLKLLSGMQGIAQNDLIFCFYITASIWCFAEYWVTKNRKWLIGIGLFSAAAILTKWLVGLLVYAGWGIALLSSKERRLKLSNYIDGCIAFGITCLGFLPWQLYTSYRFPTESAHEYAYNNKHLFEAVEGHKASFWFHFEQMPYHYGSAAWLLILLGVIYTICYSQKKGLLVAFLTNIVVVYLFFTIATTKMASFTYIVAPLFYVLFGALVWGISQSLTNVKESTKTTVTVGVLIVMSVFNFRFGELELHRIKGWWGSLTQKMTNNTVVFRKLDTLIPEKSIVLNTMHQQCIDIMFYSKHIAYDGIEFNEAQLKKLKTSGYPIVIMQAPDYPIPKDTVVKELDAQILELDLKDYR